MNGHYGFSALTKYFLGKMQPDDVTRLEEHLIECDTCAALAGEVHRGGYGESPFSPAEFARQYWRDRLDESSREIEESNPGSAPWMIDVFQQASGAVRVVWDVSSVVANYVHGAIDHLLAAPRLLADPETAPAASPVLASAGGPGPSFCEIGNESLRAHITRSRESLTIKFQGDPGPQGPPAMVLVPVVPGTPARCEAAKYDETERAWIATFPQPPLDALLLFGP